MSLGIVGNTLVAEVNAVFQDTYLFPVLPIIAVIESSGQFLHHYFQIHRAFLHLVHFRHQFLAVIAVDDQLNLPSALIAQSASGIGGCTVVAGQSGLFWL
jgi:hypothetical protein